MTDREKAGLRGPVKTCVEEGSYAVGKYLITTEFTSDGKLLSTRHTNPDGSEWSTVQAYDPAGRLVKTTVVQSGEVSDETTHSYDETGRRLHIAHAPKKGDRTEFHYDEQGVKSSIQYFDPETLRGFQTQSVSVGGSFWDAATHGIGVPMGGTITTSYNANDQPIEAQVRDADGQVVTRFVRTYDTAGRMMEDKAIPVNAGRAFVARMVERARTELKGQIAPDEVAHMNQAVNAFFGDEPIQTMSYAYDAQGRERINRRRAMGFDSTTTTIYNDRGEKAEERRTLGSNNAFLSGVRARFENAGLDPPNMGSEALQALQNLPELDVGRFEYEYDSHGNWTQQLAMNASHPELPSTARNRKFTYF